MSYVDGFVAAVPTANKQKFIDYAQFVDPIFKKHGALSVIECWGDDVPDGEVTSFPMAVKAAADETVLFSWVIWPDKATRDAGNEKIMAELEKQPEIGAMPFDGKRLIYGGFEVVVEL